VETARVEDGQSGRFAEVPRPLAEYLSPGELVELEQSVRTSFNIAQHDEAEQALDRIAAGDPTKLMYGLLWLTSMWSSLSAARIGVTVPEFTSALGYRGLRFDLSGESEQSWATGEQALRRGVLAVATSVEDTHECLRVYGRLDPGLARLRWIMLAIMDGLAQDMERNGLAPWGAAGHVVRGAGWAEPE
jgi:hypothetical protein